MGTYLLGGEGEPHNRTGSHCAEGIASPATTHTRARLSDVSELPTTPEPKGGIARNQE